MPNCPTPHIAAQKSDFANTVLMPGDPLRAKFIAEHFLDAPKLVNNVRGASGYTGSYRGVRVSVMASGMGMPSMGIYSHELFCDFDVQTILRVGSAGAFQETIGVRDLVLGMSASTDSSFASVFRLPGQFAPSADFEVLQICAAKANELDLRFHVGNLLSSDHFYSEEEGLPKLDQSNARWAKMGVLAVEMEAAALYLNAARYRKRALAICTISNHLITGEELSTDERERGFTDMIRLALETAFTLG